VIFDFVGREDPIFVPKKTSDVGDYEGDYYVNGIERPFKRLGYEHQEIYDSPIEKSIEPSHAREFGNLEDDRNSSRDDKRNPQRQVGQDNKKHRFQHDHDKRKLQKTKIQIFNNRNGKDCEGKGDERN
jgi:hypothetical protein